MEGKMSRQQFNQYSRCDTGIQRETRENPPKNGVFDVKYLYLGWLTSSATRRPTASASRTSSRNPHASRRPARPRGEGRRRPRCCFALFPTSSTV